MTNAPDLMAVDRDRLCSTLEELGRFDGALGGLEIVRCLDDAGIETQRPVEVVVLTDEEGVRSGTVTRGSAAASGRIPLQQARELARPQAVTVGNELARHGLPDGGPVPGLKDGISHNPQECSTPEASADGITVMLRAVCDLAGVPAVPQNGGDR